MKKYLAIGPAMFLMGSTVTYGIMESRLGNTSFENDTYILSNHNDGTEEAVATDVWVGSNHLSLGMLNLTHFGRGGSTFNYLSTEGFSNIRNFTNIDWQNLTVSSDSNNPSDISLVLINDSSGEVVDTVDSLSPGTTWIGQTRGIGNHTLIGRAVDEAGRFTLTLKW